MPDETGYISTDKEVLKHRQRQANIQALVALTIAIIILVLSFWYSWYQYQLCYPEVSDSFWYCFQHAAGG